MNEQPALCGKLVSAEQLLDQLFDPQSRPSLRWLRGQTKAKTIPFFRIGHLIYFDVEMVRAALVEKNLVLRRMRAGKVGWPQSSPPLQAQPPR